MGFLTYGHLHVTARRIETELPLDDLREHLLRKQYSGNAPTRGWAGISWRTEGEDGPKLDRTNPGRPTIEDFGEYRILLARLYSDQINKALLRKLGKNFEGLSVNQRFDVVATDVLVIEGRSLYVFIASHESTEVSAVLAELRASASATADAWTVGELPKINPSSDLYLWMLYRWHAFNGNLSPTLQIVEFNTLSTRDAQDHIIRSLSGIDLTRVDTLGAAAEAHELGPAKFVLVDKQTGLRADLFLLRNGTFDIHRGNTEYDGIPLDKAQLGIYATLDVATKVLPRLHNAHKNDGKWPTEARPKFVKECRQALYDRFKG